MLTRTTNLAASQLLMNHVTATRTSVDDLQGQLASGRTSRTYAGIATASERHVGLEAKLTLYQRFTTINDRMDRNLTITEGVLDSTRSVANDVRFALIEFGKTIRTDPVEVRTMQEQAFKALQSLEALLNTEHEGRYLFAGTKARTQPVNLNLTTLEAFQQRYDGNAVTYPTTREAHLVSVELGHADTGDLVFDRQAGTITATTAGSLNRIPIGATLSVGGTGSNDARYTVVGNDGTELTIRSEKLALTEAAAAAALTGPDGLIFDATATGGLTLDAAAGTITAAIPGALSGLKPGAIFALSDAPTVANDGDYAVLANDGTTITIVQHTLQDETPAPPTATLAVQALYSGDTVSTTHRADQQHEFAVDLTAIDPTFEKLVRGFGLLAQGKIGTEGGLDRHPERVAEALYLINSAIERSVAGDPPFGPEARGNLEETAMTVGFQRVILSETNTRLATRIASLENEIAGTEAADPTETSLRLFDQMNVLETSLATMARVRQLSLANFL